MVFFLLYWRHKNTNKMTQPRLFMPFIDYFYEEEREGESYTDQPTGLISADRVVQRHPDYWLNSYPSSVRKKKTLILMDWTLADGANLDSKKTLLQEWLQGNDPFAVNAWQDGELVPLTADNLDDFFNNQDQLQRITLAKKAKIDAAIKQAGLNPEQCLYLDDYRFREHTATAPLAPQTQLTDITRLTVHRELKRDVTDIQQAALSFYNEFTININQFSQNAEEFINRIAQKKSLAETTIVCFVEELYIGSHYTAERFVQDKQLLFGFDTITLTWSALRHIKTLRLPKHTDIPTIQALLSATPHLTTLRLPERTNIDRTPLQLPPGSLAKLERLDLARCDLSTENVEVVLQASPNLKELNLSWYYPTKSTLQFALQKLETLNLSSSRLPWKICRFCLLPALTLRHWASQATNSAQMTYNCKNRY